MNKNKAKLKFYPNRFEVIEEGDYVVCAVSGKNILLKNLNYWNVDLQEAYSSPIEAKVRYQQLNKKKVIISIYYVSKSIVLDFLKSYFQLLYLFFL